MTIFGQELVADRSALSRFFAAVVAISRATGHALARIVRIRRDRARLDELPDYLLHDIGVGRSEIRWITKYGRREHGEA
ncbi:MULTISPECIES: DUF1127 domain-containing protein [unclassified Mesorhizobium]|jgi:uncharacterized protein YjiS (DUF1127 family)|uniref:DUF1127 domain-containing protein n=1 Tax=unclassified Mesorhizobium TaxID=325217 RepID=UPI000FDA6C3F|nr:MULTISPECIES: DUF1127 domain-containing protein [unclassified Mesorhizobium]TGQ06603.1 DUF1127 domain-containing protein [Mesorhizobium sp. M2E.F.Ca.ET.219.01.1.1]TGT63133.1 DUF1127 domain-containing protein [Mesorhizobium sp. M2E.F.Ca.ET.166.01.1.1]TGV96807.1 DUF1127 domain-containing protein [Mesorhizobium sp. M2E.F.Ca.ET.154.01.1.1]